jgi:alpha-tubulin suppressor-like RCC1 family protein
MRRLEVWVSAGALLASVVAIVVTIGASAAHAASFEDWSSVSAGENFTCGIRHGGKLYCWGNDFYGQVGDGGTNEESITTPRRIGDFEDWASIAAGGFHACGVRKNGKLYCWGRDDNGQVGDAGPDANVSAPKRIGDFEDWTSVGGGLGHTCGIRHGGKLYCWGRDNKGQVGDAGDNTNISSPKRIGDFEDWARVDGGNSHTCGVRENGKLYCWGDDTYGQLGTPTLALAPYRIGDFQDWSSVSAGADTTCGIRHGGKLYCWGDNAFGQVGIGEPEPGHPIPVPNRVGSFEDWATSSTGDSHNCGVRKNGKLYCWGYDGEGQVGDGFSDSFAYFPRRIGDFEDWAKISAGGSHSCGVRSNGKLYCWGDDTFGQIGDGGVSSDPHKSPTRI